uniref:(northern house mosquito) hypothetical protein n=1 Tax=Culex pipiens TaxID=7175 RepID=A0A8D8FLY9_CULPI
MERGAAVAVAVVSSASTGSALISAGTLSFGVTKSSRSRAVLFRWRALRRTVFSSLPTTAAMGVLRSLNVSAILSRILDLVSCSSMISRLISDRLVSSFLSSSLSLVLVSSMLLASVTSEHLDTESDRRRSSLTADVGSGVDEVVSLGDLSLGVTTVLRDFWDTGLSVARGLPLRRLVFLLSSCSFTVTVTSFLPLAFICLRASTFLPSTGLPTIGLVLRLIRVVFLSAVIVVLAVPLPPPRMGFFLPAAPFRAVLAAGFESLGESFGSAAVDFSFELCSPESSFVARVVRFVVLGAASVTSSVAAAPDWTAVSSAAF